MTADLRFADSDADARPLWLVPQGADGPDWPEAVPRRARAWATAAGFTAKAGQASVVPGGDGTVAGAVFGLGKPRPRPDAPARERFPLARAAEAHTMVDNSRHTGKVLLVI